MVCREVPCSISITLLCLHFHFLGITLGSNLVFPTFRVACPRAKGPFAWGILGRGGGGGNGAGSPDPGRGRRRTAQ